MSGDISCTSSDADRSPSPDEALSALSDLWDASLLHNVAIDPTFKLKDPTEEELASITDDAIPLIQRLSMQVEMLQASSLPRQEALRHRITEALDLELAEQQV